MPTGVGPLATGFPAGWFAGLDGVSLLMLGLAVLVVVTITVAVTLALSRRRLDLEVRALVEGLEELRTGHFRRRPDVGSASPVGIVADALNRLGHDMQLRRTDLESAAERWRALSEAASDTAVVTTDIDGDVRSFSKGASALFGWDEEDIVSRPASVLFEEGAYKDLLPLLARRETRRRGVTGRARATRRDGSFFESEVSVRMLSGTAAEPTGFLLVVRDATSEVALERELRDSEARYRGLVEGLAEGVILIQKGRVIYANAAAEALLAGAGGAARLSGMALREAIATRDVLVVEEALEALESRRLEEAELRCSLARAGDGAVSEVRMLARSVDYSGSPAALLVVQDETTERRIQAELRRNEARFDAVLEATSDGILVLGNGASGGTVHIANRAFAQLFGLELERILGLHEDGLCELLRARDEGARALAEVIRSRRSSVRAEIALGDAAASRAVHVSVAPLEDRPGERSGRIVVLRDLSEQRRNERQLQEQAEKLQLGTAELEAAYRRLNAVNVKLMERGEQVDRLNQELKRLDEMKSNLLGNVSHELQTPLVSIRGYTEMILKERLGPITEEQRKGLQLALKNIDRLIAMIDNLMAFQRTDSKLGGLKLDRFGLAGLVEEAVALLREKIAGRDLTVSLSLDGDHELEADRDKILQVVLNLLSNAVKYNHKGGAIEILAEPGQPGFVTVRVKDTGIGIPADELNRIFDRHYRVRRDGTEPSAASEGSGIGLAIVRDILRLHGCTIRAESEIGRGSEFVFTLPLAERAAPSEPLPSEPPAAEATPGAGPGASPGESPAAGERDSAGEAPRPRFRIIRRDRGQG